jgi:hypothetical protein
MIVSLLLYEFVQLGSAALSGHGEVLGPISGLRAKIKKIGKTALEVKWLMIIG